jgi:hypothetical protein
MQVHHSFSVLVQCMAEPSNSPKKLAYEHQSDLEDYLFMLFLIIALIITTFVFSDSFDHP